MANDEASVSTNCTVPSSILMPSRRSVPGCDAPAEASAPGTAAIDSTRPLPGRSAAGVGETTVGATATVGAGCTTVAAGGVTITAPGAGVALFWAQAASTATAIRESGMVNLSMGTSYGGGTIPTTASDVPSRRRRVLHSACRVPYDR